jgi:hypothetical protein
MRERAAKEKAEAEMKAAHDRATLPRGCVDCGSTSHVAAGCPGPKQPRQPIGHVLKSEPRQFQDVIEGAKVFEVRKDDRDFATGDTVVLVEYDRRRSSTPAARRRVRSVISGAARPTRRVGAHSR